MLSPLKIVADFGDECNRQVLFFVDTPTDEEAGWFFHSVVGSTVRNLASFLLLKPGH